MKPKRVSVAERFRKQMDLLTGDKRPIPKLPFPLISLPPEKLYGVKRRFKHG